MRNTMMIHCGCGRMARQTEERKKGCGEKKKRKEFRAKRKDFALPYLIGLPFFYCLFYLCCISAPLLISCTIFKNKRVRTQINALKFK